LNELLKFLSANVIAYGRIFEKYYDGDNEKYQRDKFENIFATSVFFWHRFSFEF